MRIAWSRLAKRMPLIVASVLLAFFLWLLVIGEEKIEAGFMVPLVFDKIPPSMVIDGPPLSSVYVQLQGARQVVANIIPQEIKARVDLSDVKPGKNFIRITTQDIEIPLGTTLLGVYPPYLDIKFLAKISVPIKVKTVGKPAKEFTVKRITVMPLQVEVVGPPARLEAIKKVETLPVDITGQQKGMVQVRAEFVQPGDDVRVLQLGPTEVVVEIEEKQLERTISGIPIEVGERTVVVEPSQAVVVVRGRYRLMKGLKKEQIQVRVDWNSPGEGESKFTLAVDLPPELVVLSLDPAQVKVKEAAENLNQEGLQIR